MVRLSDCSGCGQVVVPAHDHLVQSLDKPGRFSAVGSCGQSAGARPAWFASRRTVQASATRAYVAELVGVDHRADGLDPPAPPPRSWLSGGVGGLAVAAESLDRRCRGRAEASDGRLLVGQVREESGRITVAVSVGQVCGTLAGDDRSGLDASRSRGRRSRSSAGRTDPVALATFLRRLQGPAQAESARAQPSTAGAAFEQEAVGPPLAQVIWVRTSHRRRVPSTRAQWRSRRTSAARNGVAGYWPGTL
jgi:hypothetical protein